MDFQQYLKKSKSAERLLIEIGGESVSGVYFRKLNAGEGLQLKDAFADLMQTAGDALGDIQEGDIAKAEEKAKAKLTPDQLRAMFAFQALFTFLHLANKDGTRAFEDRKEFDREVPDDFIQAFYAAGAELKNKTQDGEGEAEKN